MIIKSFELNKKKLDNYKYFLFYGENEGYKEESLLSITRNKKTYKTFRYLFIPNVNLIKCK